MATVIVMPRLSPTMEEGVLAKWTKKEGDKIAPGDIIAEVETDKANMDFPLEDEGVLLKLLAKPGDTVKLGAPVAILGEAGEDFSAALAEAQGGGKPAPAAEEAEPEAEAKPAAKTASKPPKAAAKPAAKPAEAESDEKPAEAEAESDSAETESGDSDKASAKAPAKAADEAAPAESATETESAEAAPATKGRLITSPLARRLADEAGLDIRKITGSGPGGRIVKRDIERAAAAQKTAASEAAAEKTPAKPPEATKAATAEAGKAATAEAGKAAAKASPAPAPAATLAQDEEISLPMIRRIAAKRLVEAKQTVPHIYLTSDAAVDGLWQFREELNRAAMASGGDKVSFNDLALKALARALRVVPAANTSFGSDGQHAARHHRVDISVAVALEDGLITPVVRSADQKSIGALSREVRELAQRGRDKKLRPEEYTGGTFSLTNLGMYGVREFCAIINPPESGILAVGRIEKRPIVVEHDGHDEVTVGRRMTLTLSCDHRILDGVLGGQLLAEVVRGLEQPLLLVL